MKLKDYLQTIPRKNRRDEMQRIANYCNASIWTVISWANGRKRVGHKRMKLLEHATRYKVTRGDMWNND